MRGIVFTIDAVAAAAFFMALLSLVFLLLSMGPGGQAPAEHFAQDVLAALDGGEIDDAQVRQIFLLSNKCGSVVVRSPEGELVESAYPCGCEQGSESVAYRSFVSEREGALEILLTEARVCKRV